MKPTIRRSLALAAALIGLLVFCPPACAQLVLGENSGNTGDWYTAYPDTEIQVGSGGPHAYTVPAGGGIITSWANQADALASGFIALKVFEPTASPIRFRVVAESALEPITAGRLDTYPTQLVVAAGDVLGYSHPGAAAISAFFFTEDPADSVAQAPGTDDPLGAITTTEPAQTGVRLNISAVLEQPPAVTALAPAEGPLTGGTTVAIHGHDLAEAGSVSFGATPAASFAAGSDEEITAVAPAAAGPGPVDVSVTTPLGATPPGAADRFTYTACVVPHVQGQRLAAAERNLKSAGCALGALSRRRSRRARIGRVLRQSAPAGRVLAPGTAIALSVGRHGAGRRS